MASDASEKANSSYTVVGEKAGNRMNARLNGLLIAST